MCCRPNWISYICIHILSDARVEPRFLYNMVEYLHFGGGGEGGGLFVGNLSDVHERL